MVAQNASSFSSPVKISPTTFLSFLARSMVKKKRNTHSDHEVKRASPRLQFLFSQTENPERRLCSVRHFCPSSEEEGQNCVARMSGNENKPH